MLRSFIIAVTPNDITPRLALQIPVDFLAAFIPFDKLGISDQSVIKIDTALFAIMSGLTFIVTGLIATRLLLVRRRVFKSMD